MKRALTIFLILIGYLPAQAGTQFYVVKRGETMSSIAADVLPGDDSIYRRGGRLEKLMALNPTVSNFRKILPGTRVALPVIQAIYVKIDLRAPASETSSVIQASDRAEVPAQEQTLVIVQPTLPIAASPAVVTAATAVQATPPKPTVISETESYSPVLEVNLNAAFYNVRSRDRASESSANFVSDLAPGFGVTLAQPFSKTCSVYGNANYTQLKILQPSSQSRVQQPSAQKGLGVGLKHDNAGVLLAVEAGLTQNIFPRATAVNEFSFDLLSVPYTRVALGLEPLQTNRARAGFVATYDYLGRANSGPQRASAGKNLGGEVYWSYRFKSERSYRLGVTYNKNEQNTNLSQQEHSSVGLNFTLSWPLGE